MSDAPRTVIYLMGWLVVILAPLLFAVFAVYAVLKFAVVLVRICFAPVVWLSRQPPQQRVELYHYERR